MSKLSDYLRTFAIESAHGLQVLHSKSRASRRAADKTPFFIPLDSAWHVYFFASQPDNATLRANLPRDNDAKPLRGFQEYRFDPSLIAESRHGAHRIFILSDLEKCKKSNRGMLEVFMNDFRLRFTVSRFMRTRRGSSRKRAVHSLTRNNKFRSRSASRGIDAISRG